MPLVGDQRECAKAVDKLLAARPRWLPKPEGEVEYHRGYGFGHYDSRGGAMLVLGCKSALQAMIAYNRYCYWGDLNDAAFTDLCDGFGEVDVIVCGEPLPGGGTELLEDRGGRYAVGVVETHSIFHDGHITDWRQVALILWVPTEEQAQAIRDADDNLTSSDQWVDATKYGCPTIPAKPIDAGARVWDEIRIRWTDPGEDAYGLSLVRVDDVKELDNVKNDTGFEPSHGYSYTEDIKSDHGPGKVHY